MDSDTVKLLRDAGKIIKAHCKVTNCWDCPFQKKVGMIVTFEEVSCEFTSRKDIEFSPCDWEV